MKNGITNTVVNGVKNTKMQQKIVYEVNEIKDLLGLGINQTYELIKSNQFPVRKVGSKYIIPKQTFLNYFMIDI